MPWEQPGAADRGTVIRAEYEINPNLSIVTERDGLGNVRSDLQFRRRMGGPQEEANVEVRDAIPADRDVDAVPIPEMAFHGTRVFRPADLTALALPSFSTRRRDAPSSSRPMMPPFG